MTAFDVLVAGAGHNSLVCAAYLARAGLRVLVLERAAKVGGDTSTEELTLPGFHHDTCASAHTVFQSSPIMRDDERRTHAIHAGLRCGCSSPPRGPSGETPEPYANCGIPAAA